MDGLNLPPLKTLSATICFKVCFGWHLFAWAHRAYDLEVGSRPIPAKTLTSDNLAAAIHFAFQDNIKANAKTLAKNIATENGALDCAKVIVASLERQ